MHVSDCAHKSQLLTATGHLSISTASGGAAANHVVDCSVVHGCPDSPLRQRRPIGAISLAASPRATLLFLQHRLRGCKILLILTLKRCRINLRQCPISYCTQIVSMQGPGAVADRSKCALESPRGIRNNARTLSRSANFDLTESYSASETASVVVLALGELMRGASESPSRSPQ